MKAYPLICPSTSGFMGMSDKPLFRVLTENKSSSSHLFFSDHYSTPSLITKLLTTARLLYYTNQAEDASPPIWDHLVVCKQLVRFWVQIKPEGR
ncbi:hypothetical protein STEG23_015141, partial [Scotinomys teguina]